VDPVGGERFAAADPGDLQRFLGDNVEQQAAAGTKCPPVCDVQGGFLRFNIERPDVLQQVQQWLSKSQRRRAGPG
jgi:hypothetical protein